MPSTTSLLSHSLLLISVLPNLSSCKVSLWYVTGKRWGFFPCSSWAVGGGAIDPSSSSDGHSSRPSYAKLIKESRGRLRSVSVLAISCTTWPSRFRRSSSPVWLAKSAPVIMWSEEVWLRAVLLWNWVRDSGLVWVSGRVDISSLYGGRTSDEKLKGTCTDGLRLGCRIASKIGVLFEWAEVINGISFNLDCWFVSCNWVEWLWCVSLCKVAFGNARGAKYEDGPLVTVVGGCRVFIPGNVAIWDWVCCNGAFSSLDSLLDVEIGWLALSWSSAILALKPDKASIGRVDNTLENDSVDFCLFLVKECLPCGRVW